MVHPLPGSANLLSNAAPATGAESYQLQHGHRPSRAECDQLQRGAGSAELRRGISYYTAISACPVAYLQKETPPFSEFLYYFDQIISILIIRFGLNLIWCSRNQPKHWFKRYSVVWSCFISLINRGEPGQMGLNLICQYHLFFVETMT